jgi:trans-aconitate 2-methyltransferase
MVPLMTRWNPATYLKFAGERLRPALDLIARIDMDAPGVIVDLGCGDGNVTRFLVERWPDSVVVGVDSSAEMLAEARVRQPDLAWIEADLAAWIPEQPADILFSNAALHWLDDHRALFPRLAQGLRPGGILAVQMPRNHDQPSHRAMIEAVEAGPWRDRLRPCLRTRPVAPPDVYADILAPVTSFMDIWETVYWHILEGDNPVVAWTRGTALRPLLAALDGEERAAFLGDYARRVERAYPRRDDGKTLFPFRRLFIVARR